MYVCMHVCMYVCMFVSVAHFFCGVVVADVMISLSMMMIIC